MKDFRIYFKEQLKKKSHQYGSPCLSVGKKPLCPSWLLCKRHTCGRIFAKQSCVWMMAHATHGWIKREGSLRETMHGRFSSKHNDTLQVSQERESFANLQSRLSSSALPAKQTRPSGYWEVLLSSGALGGSRNARPSFLGRWTIRKPS